MSDHGLKLNPLYEISSELDLLDAGHYGSWPSGCLLERTKKLATRRPELAPFLAPAMTRAGAGAMLPSFALRETLRRMFAFGIPAPAAISSIAALGSIVEIGAGTGYWSALLAGAGAQVNAFDNFSWKLAPLWFPVERGGAVRAGAVDSDVLLLCWPPYRTPMASKALQAFRGQTVVYVGEGYGGCTATDRFHDELERGWNLDDRLPSVRWHGLHDRVEIWRRRTACPALEE